MLRQRSLRCSTTWASGSTTRSTTWTPHAGTRADYLRAEGRTAWEPIVDRMILEHHRLRPVRDAPLVEAFRRADLADLSFGLLRPGIPRGTYRRLVREHPIAGFHARLVTFGVAQVRKDPRHPLPMLRW